MVYRRQRMSAGNIFVVLNPKSGGGKLAKRARELHKLLGARLGQNITIEQTTGPSSATSLTKEAIQQGFERIIAVGGDGTINEVVNGFFSSAEDTGRGTMPTADALPSLGIIPFGTGSDLSRSLELPRDPRAALMLIERGHTRTFDVGRISCKSPAGRDITRYFLNIASCGLSSGVVERVNRGRKKLGGRLSFAVATLAEMRRFRPAKLRITMDDRPAHEISVHVIAICNFRYFGGGMFIAPKAVGDDGYFDVVTIEPMGKAAFLTRASAVYSGTHIHRKDVHYERARRVVIEQRPSGRDQQPSSVLVPLGLDVDGEVPGTLPATFENLPRALRLIVSEHVAS
jgi:YegS/Rv2252/BmrU family lipid kinase